MFSGRKSAALVAVALLHMALVCAFYFGLAQPIVEHFTPPVKVEQILKPRERVVLEHTEPKIDQRKLLQYEPPEDPTLPTQSGPTVMAESKHVDPPTIADPTPAQRMQAATGARMDPRHPLHIGPDYYPSAAIRAGQEGRCIVQVSVAADGRIISSSLQATSGFPVLDAACLSAVRGQHMLPATQGGRPVESNASLPIVWRLTGSR
jgi:TonB family protein